MHSCTHAEAHGCQAPDSGICGGTVHHGHHLGLPFRQVRLLQGLKSDEGHLWTAQGSQLISGLLVIQAFSGLASGDLHETRICRFIRWQQYMRMRVGGMNHCPIGKGLSIKLLSWEDSSHGRKIEQVEDR